jgi:predicted nucleic acid-binding protein
MRFMLDTHICIYAIKHRPPEVLAALRAHEAAGLGL